MSATVRVVTLGDAALALEFDNRIDEDVNARAIATADTLAAMDFPGIRDIVPTFRSVAVYFDPLRTDYGLLRTALARLAFETTSGSRPGRPVIEIPVRYGGALGPDLTEVARVSAISEREVVLKHAGCTYRVFMLGFVPGFAYMGTVDPVIAVPRRAIPRTRVPAGSVAIAAQQTGIYPSETPGGWHIIGHTDVKPFDVSRADPFLLQAGDRVRFQPVEGS